MKPSRKYKPFSRPAVDRGIPVRLVDAIIALTGADETEITADSKLEGDLGMDDLDVTELGEMVAHEAEDACLDWLTVSDVMQAMQARKAATA